MILEIITHVLIIIFMVIIIAVVIIYAGQQAWLMAQLKNKCIADCVEFNKKAVENNLTEWCMC